MKEVDKKQKSYSGVLYFRIISFLLILSLSGCAGFTSPARKHVLETDTAYWFDYDASRRGAFMIPSDDQNVKKNVKICAEPSPDVALQILDKFKLTVSIEKIPVSGQADISQQVIQLAGRGQSILFLREALYRLCEVSLNNQLTKEQILEMYKQVIEVSSKLAEAELTKAEAELTKEKTRLLEIRKDIDMKIEEIANYVNENGKVSKEKLSELTRGTSVEKIFEKFYGKPVEEFKDQLVNRYLEYVDLLFEKIKSKQ